MTIHRPFSLLAKLAIACCVAFMAACATAPRSVVSRLSVVVHAGQPSVPTWPSRSGRIELLVDATRSTAQTKAGPASALDAAREGIVRLVKALPEDGELRLHVLGGAAGSGARCSVGDETLRSVSITGAEEVRRALREGSPGEAELAAALDAVVTTLAGEGALAGARIVVASDLDAACLGDVCAATARAVSGGASIDWMLFGGAPVPECLTVASVPAEAPTPLALQGRIAPPRVVVVPKDAFVAGGARAQAASITGSADGIAFDAPPGEVFVQVELSPRLVIGPVILPPGGAARIEVLEFPAASPPTREWRVDPAHDPATGTGSSGR